MSVIGFDLGGTKLSGAVFSNYGKIIIKENLLLDKRKGKEVGILIKEEVKRYLNNFDDIEAIGISVPGISYSKTGKVWAPNIPGWEDYPLLQDIKEVSRDNIKVLIDSDRACYILGEVWQGAAKGCNDAIFLAVGTGIGAGILVNGEILRGSNDIAGAIGWLALDRPFFEKYISCGCFEYHASGEGLAKVGKELLQKDVNYEGILNLKKENHISAHDIFTAYAQEDPLAEKVIKQAIEFWGMTTANLVSLFNPEKIIFGGGVFGPAVKFLDDIFLEAKKWAQPISINQVKLAASMLGGDAGLYGAGYLALKQNLNE
ncbi:MAG: ROK family protein [Ignavibacteriales bacterium]|nr:MAG: ROK family protein [Ignavibacteriales bacterium]RPI76429.1 MAG: ROK family protein [Ignavibacteriales bacterium]